VELKELIALPNTGKTEGTRKDRQEDGAQQERLVRVSPSKWALHMQFPVPKPVKSSFLKDYHQEQQDDQTLVT